MIRTAAPSPPELDLQEFFRGKTKAEGSFIDRFGVVRAQFTALCVGRLERGALTLQEDFTFLSGARESRVWTIRKRGESSYEGTCADLPGIARGRAIGAALTWAYPFHLRMGGRRVRVRYHDTMVLVAQDCLLSQGRVEKFGVRIGEVVTVFRKDVVEAGFGLLGLAAE